MTLRHGELARHALGLPNKERRSYRNRFCAGPGHTDYPDWVEMEKHDGASRVSAKRAKTVGDLFFLTRKGAERLVDRESLCPEDFPPGEEPRCG